MTRSVAVLAFSTVALCSAAALAGNWKELRSDEYRLRMNVPEGAAVKTRTWDGGWAGVEVAGAEVTLLGIAKQGAKAGPEIIASFVTRATGVPQAAWKVQPQRGELRGFERREVAKAHRGNRTYIAVYGAGPSAGYVLVLSASNDAFAKNEASLLQWIDSIQVW